MLTFSKLTALRHLLGFQRTRAAFDALPLGRNYSTTTNPDDKSHMIVLTDDGSTIVCWHPRAGVSLRAHQATS
uniref:Putative mitochondrial 28s ribosomal protein s32 n=1 Tax=Ixodes ricinus TaxID=34613 RepID=A0A0K8RMP2_IXORI